MSNSLTAKQISCAYGIANTNNPTDNVRFSTQNAAAHNAAVSIKNR
jgi:hypothetical protein